MPVKALAVLAALLVCPLVTACNANRPAASGAQTQQNSAAELSDHETTDGGR